MSFRHCQRPQEGAGGTENGDTEGAERTVVAAVSPGRLTAGMPAKGG